MCVLAINVFTHSTAMYMQVNVFRGGGGVAHVSNAENTLVYNLYTNSNTTNSASTDGLNALYKFKTL